MSELIAITYPDEGTAADVLSALRRLQAEGIVQFDDACIVTRDAAGGLVFQQRLDVDTDSASAAALRAALLGALVFIPLVGLALGAATAPAGQALAQLGLDDGFVSGLRQRLLPKSSAVLLTMRKASIDQLPADVRRLGGRVMRATLGLDGDERLRAALSSAAAQER